MGRWVQVVFDRVRKWECWFLYVGQGQGHKVKVKEGGLASFFGKGSDINGHVSPLEVESVKSEELIDPKP